MLFHLFLERKKSKEIPKSSRLSPKKRFQQTILHDQIRKIAPSGC